MIYYFIKRTVGFCSIAILTYVALFVTVSILISRKLDTMALKANENIVVLGDSHIKLAIDPQLMNNSVSYAQHSEPYLISYIKLKKLLQKNDGISKVYLGFGYHNLSPIFDSVLVGSHEANIISKIFFIIPVDNKIDLLKHNAVDFVLWNSTFRNGLSIVANDTSCSFLGGYTNGFKISAFNDSIIAKRIQFHYYDKGIIRPISTTNIYWLYQIIELCKSENVELIFLKTPLHRNYEMRIPTIYVHKFNEIVIRSGITLIDFHQVRMTDNDFVTDGDHVTQGAADKLSFYLAQSIK